MGNKLTGGHHRHNQPYQPSPQKSGLANETIPEEILPTWIKGGRDGRKQKGDGQTSVISQERQSYPAVNTCCLLLLSAKLCLTLL